MGKHYVPRAHLRRFQAENNPGFVWMYDKKTGRFAEASVSKVAQEADFYSQEVEIALAEVVEAPGNACIDKLLRQERLDNAERTQLSLYMMTMATRGPRQRRKSLEHAPEALESVISDTRKEIEDWIQESPDDVERAQSRLKELDAVHERFSKELPQQVLDQIHTPFWSERTVDCLHNMAWHILPAPPSMYFVTSDTPAHFFEGLGVGNPDSEFTFPISTSFALIGEHRRSWGTTFEKPHAQFAKEVNRRVLANAERFVFSPRPDGWIETVARKTSPFLSQLRWS
jgi:hypothetical protein